MTGELLKDAEALQGREPGRALLLCVFAATLCLLAFHVSLYWFLTDDAFISFRYALNWSEGHGLVFNPGHERVEGYTNFLWVAILAAVHRLTGIAPEASANPLLAGFSVVFWLLLFRYLKRFSLRARATTAVVLIAPLCLASTRSFAVWTTSGLETRLFELLIFAAMLSVLSCIQRRTSALPAAGLFALATLTRPEGLLFAATAGLVWLYSLQRVKQLSLAEWIPPLVLFAAIVGSHLAFRYAYYGDWLPNTYYAKVGHPWWTMGFSYALTMGLEYGAYLWAPVIAFGAWAHWKRGQWYVPVLIACALIPHAIYVMRIGGDHFEYRPFDLYLPFALLLFADGIAAFASTRRRTIAAFAYGALVLYAIVALPMEVHRRYPSVYEPGFPNSRREAGRAFLSEDLPLLYRVPGFDRLGQAYTDLLRNTVSHFAGVRQEEHALFLATVIPPARRLHQLLNDGVLPPDTHIGICCVGAYGYYSGLRIFDRLGLTDRMVARAPSAAGDSRAIAHERQATFQQAWARKVDFWSVDPVHPLSHATQASFYKHLYFEHRKGSGLRDQAYFAELGDGFYLLARLPMGLAATKERFPELAFQSVKKREAVAAALHHAGRLAAPRARGLEPSLDWQQINHLAGMAHFEFCNEGYLTCASRSGRVRFKNGDFEEALALFEATVAFAPHDAAAAAHLGATLAQLGRPEEAATAFQRALALDPDQPIAREELREQGGAAAPLSDPE